MNALGIFSGEFWPVFVGFGLVFLPVQIGRRISSQGNAVVFARPKSFRELCSLSKGDQDRLFHEADSDAFPGWSAFLPTLIYVAIMSVGVGTGRTVPKVAGLHESLLLNVTLAVAFIALACWLATRWEIQSIRPFLTRRIRGITQRAA